MSGWRSAAARDGYVWPSVSRRRAARDASQPFTRRQRSQHSVLATHPRLGDLRGGFRHVLVVADSRTLRSTHLAPRASTRKCGPHGCSRWGRRTRQRSRHTDHCHSNNGCAKCQSLQRSERRLEEVVAACRRDEPLHQRNVVRLPARQRETAGSGVLRDHGVLAGIVAREVRVVDPPTLHKLELASNRALVAEEQQAAVSRVCRASRRISAWGSSGQRGAERNTATHDAMCLGIGLAAFSCRLVAWLRLADVCSERDDRTIRVIAELEVVDPLVIKQRRILDTWVG